MAEKPINMVNLGGIKFNANDAQNYGQTVDPNNLAQKKFFINFKDGTRVEYNEQGKQGILDLSTLLTGKKQQKADPTISKEHYGKDDYYTISDTENVKVYLPNKDGNEVFSSNNKNITIIGGSGDDDISSSNDKNINIAGGMGDDKVHISCSKGVKVSGGAGADEISVHDDPFWGLSTGKIKLDNADKLEIRQSEDQFETLDPEYLDEDHNKQKTVTRQTSIVKTVEIQGEGVHNLKDTKFSDVHETVTETTEVWHQEENPNYDPNKSPYEDGNEPEIYVTDEETTRVIKDERRIE